MRSFVFGRGMEFRTAAVACSFGLAVLSSACGPTRYDYPEQVAGSEQHDPLGERPDAGRGYLFNSGSPETDSDVIDVGPIRDLDETPHSSVALRDSDNEGHPNGCKPS